MQFNHEQGMTAMMNFLSSHTCRVITTTMKNDQRLQELTQWLHSLPNWENANISVASADASFRRYFRADNLEQTAVAMDAPPDLEDIHPFVDVTTRLLQAGVHAPAIIEQNLLDGFLLLEDLGNTPLLTKLCPASVDHLYQEALNTLIDIQSADATGLPPYDHDFLTMEMELMPEWFLAKHLGMHEKQIPQQLLKDTFEAITASALEQPQTFVHRDYHSRNLMCTPDNHLAVIDYQDAMYGPITYDLVSLLRDCYVHWPQSRVEKWALCFHKHAIKKGTLPPIDEQRFLRWFDLMGLQRHIKVLGIFARLYHRDGKSGYLKDLPLVLSYVLSVGGRYPETSALVAWMEESGIPQRIGTTQLAA